MLKKHKLLILVIILLIAVAGFFLIKSLTKPKQTPNRPQVSATGKQVISWQSLYQTDLKNLINDINSAANDYNNGEYSLLQTDCQNIEVGYNNFSTIPDIPYVTAENQLNEAITSLKTGIPECLNGLSIYLNHNDNYKPSLQPVAINDINAFYTQLQSSASHLSTLKQQIIDITK